MITLDLNKDASAGISLDLKKDQPKLNKIKALLDWDIHPVHKNSTSQGFDLDLWCFLINKDKKIDDAQKVVYFNNKNYNNGGIVLPRDNRTGEGDDDEELNFDLSKLPPNHEAVIFVFLFEADKRGQHFGMVANSSIKISNMDTGVDIVKYDITKDFNGKTAICVGQISSEGIFTPIGDSSVVSVNDVLGAYS